MMEDRLTQRIHMAIEKLTNEHYGVEKIAEDAARRAVAETVPVALQPIEQSVKESYKRVDQLNVEFRLRTEETNRRFKQLTKFVDDLNKRVNETYRDIKNFQIKQDLFAKELAEMKTQLNELKKITSKLHALINASPIVYLLSPPFPAESVSRARQTEEQIEKFKESHKREGIEIGNKMTELKASLEALERDQDEGRRLIYNSIERLQSNLDRLDRDVAKLKESASRAVPYGDFIRVADTVSLPQNDIYLPNTNHKLHHLVHKLL